MSRATASSREAKASRSFAHTVPNKLAVELAELVRDLHESLESYAPIWYTEQMDDRIRETLSAAESSFQTATGGR